VIAVLLYHADFTLAGDGQSQCKDVAVTPESIVKTRAATNDSFKGSTKGVRYMPTPTFDTRQSVRLAEEAESLKVRHLVSGHIRTLPAGHHGSEHARQTAPKHTESDEN